MAITTIDLSRLDGTNGFRFDGVAAGDYFGKSVSSAGDVNGDGFDDVIVGAFGDDLNGAFSGSGYIVYGKTSNFDATLDVSNLDGNNGFRLDGGDRAEGFDRLGYSVSNAGDINGDGFDDVIISAPGADGNNGDNYYNRDGGSSYIVFGKDSGFDAILDLSSLNGINGFRLDGGGDENSGRSVSNAGDVNGDGFDDVIVGAEFAGRYYTGSSYVVFGKASGFSAAQNLNSLNGTNGFRLNGETQYDYLGISVSSAGDMNGDGYDDVIVGANRAGPNDDIFAGSSYVVFGKTSGFDATLDLSSLNGSNGFRLDGEAAYNESGRSVSSAGDINSDGFDDVIIGVPGANSSYVIFGKASGFDASMNLSSLNGANGFRLDGASTPVSGAGDVNGDGFDDVIISSYVVFGKASGFNATLEVSSLESHEGFRLDGSSNSSVSSAGDMNGDNFADLIVGDRLADPNGESSGSSYVIFGRSDFTNGNVIAGTPGNDVLKGTLNADTFDAGDGNDRMIGRGGADEFHGDAGDDYIQVLDLAFGSVDGGSGNDVLHTDGKDLNLDLGLLGDKIHGIETICLYGRGDNELTLTAPDLLKLSDTSNTLKVHGNAGDHITVLNDGWVDGGSRGNGYYHVYTHDDAILLVGTNVATDFA